MFTKTVKIISLVAVLSITTVVEASWREFKKCARGEVTYFDGTITDLVLASVDADGDDSPFNTLLDLVLAAGLEGALADPAAKLTVFAPTDDAFAAIPGPVLDAIGTTPGVLPAVLQYHVLGKRIDPRKNALRRTADTLLEGQRVNFSRKGGLPLVNNSSIACEGFRTNNGVVWVIDSVLLPQF